MRNKTLHHLKESHADSFIKLNPKNYRTVVSDLCRRALGSINNPNIAFPLGQSIEMEVASFLWALHTTIEFKEISILSKNKKSEDQRYRSEGMEVSTSARRNTIEEVIDHVRALGNQKSLLISLAEMKEYSVSFLMQEYPEIGSKFTEIAGAHAQHLSQHLYLCVPLNLDTASSIACLPNSKSAQYQYLCSKFLEMECTGQVQGRDNLEDTLFTNAWDSLMMVLYQECEAIQFYEDIPQEYRQGESK